MRRALPWALCACMVVYACASDEAAIDVAGGTPDLAGLDASVSTPTTPPTTPPEAPPPLPAKGSCGDGKLDPAAAEQCDDGNNVDGDGCRNDCRLP